MNKEKCPLCNHVLYKRYEGLVCKNWECKLYHKLETGWVKLKRRNKDIDFFILEYKNEKSYLAKKELLLLKVKILRKYNYTCQKCGYSDIDNINNGYISKVLHVHHILRCCDFPELALDEDNLIVLCEECHKEMHDHDKYSFLRMK